MSEPRTATPVPQKCTAEVNCTNGIIRTKSCRTGRELLRTGESPEGDRDDYQCPDCGRAFSVYYEG